MTDCFPELLRSSLQCTECTGKFNVIIEVSFLHSHYISTLVFLSVGKVTLWLRKES